MKSLNAHLNKIRPLAHAAQAKNGHFDKMSKLGVEARKKKKGAKVEDE
jgi:hypothetical protein